MTGQTRRPLIKEAAKKPMVAQSGRDLQLRRETLLVAQIVVTQSTNLGFLEVVNG